jgi:hypothetical protein
MNKKLSKYCDSAVRDQAVIRLTRNLNGILWPGTLEITKISSVANIFRSKSNYLGEKGTHNITKKNKI